MYLKLRLCGDYEWVDNKYAFAFNVISYKFLFYLYYLMS